VGTAAGGGVGKSGEEESVLNRVESRGIAISSGLRAGRGGGGEGRGAPPIIAFQRNVILLSRAVTAQSRPITYSRD